MVALTVDTLPVASATYHGVIEVLRGVAVGVGVAEGVAVEVAVGDGVKVGVGADVGVLVGTAVAVRVGVDVALHCLVLHAAAAGAAWSAELTLYAVTSATTGRSFHHLGLLIVVPLHLVPLAWSTRTVRRQHTPEYASLSTMQMVVE